MLLYAFFCSGQTGWMHGHALQAVLDLLDDAFWCKPCPILF
jgi:hypothetical protein